MRDMCLPLIVMALAAPVSTLAQEQSLRSSAERTAYEETSHYDDVMRFVGELSKRSDHVRVESFGESEEGRSLPLLVMADKPPADPAAAKAAAKPVILVMANIHGGEVEGKEAAQHLARRLALDDLRPLLDQVIVLIAPIYNPDGNERISTDHRIGQNGPIGGVGTRENARGLDLNRDFMKLESAEARSLVRLIARWDPHIVVDLHTTDGSYHGYHLTYAPTLNPNADPALIRFMREAALPTIQRATKDRHGYRTYYYGNFASVDDLNRERREFAEGSDSAVQDSKKVWRTFDHRPRFGNNYVGLRNRIAILAEAYTYLEFRRRIDATEAFVEEVLRYAVANSNRILDLLRTLDAEAAGMAARRKALGVEFELRPLPNRVPILEGFVEPRQNSRSGGTMLAMIEERVKTVQMFDYGTFAATRTASIPRAYLLSTDGAAGGVAERVLETLAIHGVLVEELTEPVDLEVERFVLERMAEADRAFQGHRERSVSGRYERRRETVPARTRVIRTSQPLGLLAFYLLEPESDDGLGTWNFFDEALEAGKSHPVLKLMQELPPAATSPK